jgi:[ribosomal protein S5]-alanine N-acetyltransferase
MDSKISITFGTPENGWLPVAFRYKDIKIDIEASNVLNDPISEIKFVITQLKDDETKRITFWIEAPAYYFEITKHGNEINLFKIYSDKDVMKFRGSAAFESLDDVRKMIQRTIDQINLKSEFRFAIIENQTNNLTGTFLYKVIEPTKCEVGYSLGKNYWKLGYGFEVFNSMLTYLKNLGYENVIATTKKENITSVRLLTKTGFTLKETEYKDGLNLFEMNLSQTK